MLEQLRIEEVMKTKGLTPREQELSLLLLKGKRYCDCALLLGISINTIKYHAVRIYQKLGVDGRHGLYFCLLQAPLESGQDR